MWLAARLEEAQDQLAATREILSILARASTSEEDVFEAVVENARRICRAQVAQIHLADGEHFRLVSARGYTADYAAFAAQNPVPLNRGTLMGRIALDRRTQQIDDVLADPDYKLPDFQRLGGYRSLIGAPMVVDEEVVGVLIVWRTTVEPFDEHTADVLTTFAAAGGAGPAQRRAVLGAPGSFGAAGTQGRRDGGAGGGRERGQLDARPGRGAHDDRRARRRALRRRRRLPHGVRRGEPAVPRAHDLRHQRRRP